MHRLYFFYYKWARYKQLKIKEKNGREGEGQRAAGEGRERREGLRYIGYGEGRGELTYFADCLITTHPAEALSATTSFTIPDCTTTPTGTATVVAAGN